MSKSKIRRWSARRTAVMCSTMLTICAGAAAHAQTIEVPVPPVRLAVDERGANLATGGFQLEGNAVAIGTSDTGMAFSLSKSGLVWTQPWRYGVYVPRQHQWHRFEVVI